MKSAIRAALLTVLLGSNRGAGAATCAGAFALRIPVEPDKVGVQVEVTVNGSPEIFIVDTGAEMTGIDRAAARRLGLPAAEAPRQVHDALGVAASLPATTLTRLIFAGKVFTAVGAIVGTMEGQPFVGALGTDIIKAFDWDFDVPHGHVDVYEKGRCSVPPGIGVVRSAFADRSGQNRVTVVLDGIFELPGSLLDTGTDANSLLIDPAAAALEAQGQMTGNSGNASGVSGQPVPWIERHYDRMEIAGHRFSGATFQVSTVAARQGPPLFLGMPFFQRHRIIMSYATGALSID